MRWHAMQDMGGTSWGLVVTLVVILAALLVGLVVAFHARSSSARADAERLLSERLARGDVDPEEYARRSRALRG